MDGFSASRRSSASASVSTGSRGRHLGVVNLTAVRGALPAALSCHRRPPQAPASHETQLVPAPGIHVFLPIPIQDVRYTLSSRFSRSRRQAFSSRPATRAAPIPAIWSRQPFREGACDGTGPDRARCGRHRRQQGGRARAVVRGLASRNAHVIAGARKSSAELDELVRTRGCAAGGGRPRRAALPPDAAVMDHSAAKAALASFANVLSREAGPGGFASTPSARALRPPICGSAMAASRCPHCEHHH